MDMKREAVELQEAVIKIESDLIYGQIGNMDTIYESDLVGQFDNIAEIKQEIIECEVPKIEESSDLPTKMYHSTVYENEYIIFPTIIKQELEYSSDFEVKDISDIKEEVSECKIQPKSECELLTSHCDLPTLKNEVTDYTDYFSQPCSSKQTARKLKPLRNTAKVVFKNKTKPHSCPVCQKNFPSFKSRSKHIDGHFGKCSKADFPSTTRSKKIGSRFGKRIIVCKFCGLLVTKMDIFRHYSIHSVKNRTTKLFREHNEVCSLPQGLIIDGEQKAFRCYICYKSFTLRHNLQRHLIVHTDNRPFSFDTCPKKNMKFCLKQHLTIHTDEKPFKCYICSTKFDFKVALHQHLLCHYYDKPYECEICCKKFKYRSALQQHLITHNNTTLFICEICSKKYKRKSNLQKHLRIHPNYKPLFKCNICSKDFFLNYDLKEHLEIHSKKKPFKCNICSKEFIINCYLKRHLAIHSEEKPFKCDICFKNFKRKISLQKHLVIHTDDKPFKCDICSKNFKRKSCLKKHISIHNKPFKCDICYREFNDKSRFQNHLVVHTVTV